jgi:hypothetical protein
MKHLKLAVLLFPVVLFGCTDKTELLDSPTSELLAKVEPYIKPAIDFAYKNEKNALENGVELTEKEKVIAHKLGVKNIDKVRVLYVDELPFPQDKKLAELARSIGLDSPQMAGLTLGSGIYIKHGNKVLLSHELIHVRQYEEMGIEGFMKRYMLELAVMGYRSAPLEMEAYKGAISY